MSTPYWEAKANIPKVEDLLYEILMHFSELTRQELPEGDYEERLRKLRTHAQAWLLELRLFTETN